MSAEILDPVRRKKYEALKKRTRWNWPNGFRPDRLAADLQKEHGGTSAAALEAAAVSCQVAGRITAWRDFGKSAFLRLEDRSGAIQLYFQQNRLGEDAYGIFRDTLDLGDIIGVVGPLMKTKTGELTVSVESFQLLAKAFHPLPEKWHGLVDIETRYRRRYLDLITSPEVRKTFLLRSRLVECIRAFLSDRGFLEVETPMMQTIAGGAAARPFRTHHQALDIDLYLRIAPELYLKRLLVGGLERVFEINRNFRNEGISREHNPEFTMVEFYQAYATYEDLMGLTEELFVDLAQMAWGKTEGSYQGTPLNFTPPFRRLTFHEAIVQVGKNDPKVLSRPPVELAQLFDETVQPRLIAPTFITAWPVELSPLARRSDLNPGQVDRFEFYLAGREIANAFSELNDPIDQRTRFEAQRQARAQGDEEAPPPDEDFVEALEYGMPPAAGEGIGIDRVVMVFADCPSVRDVILFPTLKPL